MQNGLSPVNYIEKNSPAALGLIALLRSRQVGTLPKRLRLAVIQLKCFTKHVYGYNSYFDEEHFYFKYENEWRFVPTIQQIKGGRISVDFSKYNKDKIKFNKKIAPYALRFLLANIRYIYVENEFQRQKLISLFELSTEQVVLAIWQKSIKSKVV